MEEITSRRKEFAFLWDSPVPNKVIVAARGSGKTIAVLQYTIEQLLNGTKNCSAIFFSSTLKQVKQTVVKPMRQLTANFPPGFVTFNKNDLIFSFNIAKDDVRDLMLLNYKDPDEKRGLHPDIVLLDECKEMSDDMFNEVIIPMLQTENGRVIAFGTPCGHTKFWKLFHHGLVHPNWESYCLLANEMPDIFPPKLLEERRAVMTEAAYRQEYLCDWDANVMANSVYGDFMDRFTYNGNVDDSYCWDPDLPVWVAWDLGYTDHTAMWFFQVKNDLVTFIDYYEDYGHDVAFYANILLQKPYTYKKMILPFDGVRNDMRGPPISSQLVKLGFRYESLDCKSEMEGIEASRRLLKTCKFNKSNCTDALELLKRFHFKDDRLKHTVHDETADCAAAFRYAAMSKHIWNNNGFNGKIVGRVNYNVLY